MKKLFFVSALILGLNSMVFSQNWFVGAGINLRFNKESEVINSYERERDYRTVSFSPEIGYKINKFDLGVNPIIQYNYSEYDYSENNSIIQKGTGWGIGLFSRYNFITFFDKLSILGRLDVNYIYSDTYSETTQPDNSIQKYEITDHKIGLGISPVIEFKLLKNLTLYSSIIGTIVGIDYLYSSISGDRDVERHSFTFILPSVHNISLTNFSLGFYVTF